MCFFFSLATARTTKHMYGRDDVARGKVRYALNKTHDKDAPHRGSVRTSQTVSLVQNRGLASIVAGVGGGTMHIRRGVSAAQALHERTRPGPCCSEVWGLNEKESRRPQTTRPHDDRLPTSCDAPVAEPKTAAFV